RLRLFARVVEAASFTAAARDAGLAKSSVSRAITALERDLAVRLIHRTTRRLQPTEAGRAYYESVSRFALRHRRGDGGGLRASGHPARNGAAHRTHGSRGPAAAAPPGRLRRAVSRGARRRGAHAAVRGSRPRGPRP